MVYWIVRNIFLVVMKLFFGLKVEGLENVPKNTNFIVVANHTSFLDPLVVSAAIPERIYWITLRDVYNIFLLRGFMKMTDAIPTGLGSSEKAAHLLIRDKNVGMFPEGTRTTDGKLREFRRGTAVLAAKTGRPVVPCAILGAYEAYPVKAKFPKLLPLKLKIGKPVYLLKESDEIVDDIFLQEATFRVRNIIKEMLYGKKIK